MSKISYVNWSIPQPPLVFIAWNPKRLFRPNGSTTWGPRLCLAESKGTLSKKKWAKVPFSHDIPILSPSYSIFQLVYVAFPWTLDNLGIFMHFPIHHTPVHHPQPQVETAPTLQCYHTCCAACFPAWICGSPLLVAFQDHQLSLGRLLQGVLLAYLAGVTRTWMGLDGGELLVFFLRK